MGDLESRVESFSLMELPGQPRFMHLGTSYLVNDLWREVKHLKGVLDTIANKPIGDAEATCREVLSEIVDIARAAIAKI